MQATPGSASGEATSQQGPGTGVDLRGSVWLELRTSPGEAMPALARTLQQLERGLHLC